MKKVITISVVIIVLALVVTLGIVFIPMITGSVQEVQHDIEHAQYLSLPEMVQDSDVIVLATVNNVQKDQTLEAALSGGTNDKYHISDLVIFKSVKGDYKEGDVIQVKELTTDALAIKAGFLSGGEIYVLFLEDFPEVDGMPLSLKNPDQCKFRCTGSDSNYMEYIIADDDATDAFTLKGFTVKEVLERLKTGL